MKQKVIAIVGQTASGKSALSVKMAKKIGGEIISCDSRQIYIGLNIGTGKITKEEMGSIPHHLLDIANPKRVFTVAQYKKEAKKKIDEISKRKKIPIICGGTGFYLSALIDNILLPLVPPNKALRKNLNTKTAIELFHILKKKDPNRARTIDPYNKVRLTRAIEIAHSLGHVPPLKKENPYDVLTLGIKIPDEKLKKNIKKRLLLRIKKGMIKEAIELHKEGLSFKRMRELGLEYKYLAEFLEKKMGKEEMIEKLEKAIWQYAKRQKTWFKKDTRIIWTGPKKSKTLNATLKRFLEK